ncbi:MAG: tetratricopeptide repeat protein, partial [Bacteroidetes bacterium]|nr:tetratricopeptide repeat protein [Bacteroidota bacterium]
MKAGTHIIILCIIFYCIPISAQKADSLVRLLRSDLHDTTRIKIYNDLFLEYEFSEAGMAKKYVNEALVLAKRTKYLEGMAVAWTHQGFYLEDLGNYSAAIKAFGKSKEIYLEIGKKQSAKDKWFGETGVANCLINMGNSNRGIADYPAALTCYRDAQKIFESQLNSGNEAVAQTARSRIASCTYNTGNIHFYQGNLGKAKECYLKSREFYEEAGDSSGIAGCYINLSAVFFSQAKYSESLDCVQKALEICLRINDIPNLENCYINLGNIYQQRNEFQKALDYEQKALDIDERIGNKSGMSATLGNISSNYLAMGKFVDAIESAQKSLDLAKETGALEWQLTAYVNLSVASDSIGKTKEAFDYYKMSVLIKDSIYNLEKHRQLAEVEAVFQTEKKQQEIEKQQLEIKRKNFQRNAFIAGFALILLLAVIILRSYVLKRKANQVLIAKNTEISQQKEEINAQADELLMKNEMLAQRNEEILSQSEKLKEINTELEKLSIVARETDNAVIITDPEGEIAW